MASWTRRFRASTSRNAGYKSNYNDAARGEAAGIEQPESSEAEGMDANALFPAALFIFLEKASIEPARRSRAQCPEPHVSAATLKPLAVLKTRHAVRRRGDHQELHRQHRRVTT